MIAGAMSKAYDEIVTLSLVSDENLGISCGTTYQC